MSGPARGGDLLRGMSGVFVGGMIALVVALVVAWVVALWAGAPGPGPGTVIGHAVAATTSVVLQVYADRNPGARGASGALGAIVVVAGALAYEWLL